MDINKMTLTDEQYLKILNNLKKLIQSGKLKLTGFDNTCIGNKSTQCTWGLCGDNTDVYDEPSMHLFKDRSSPKYRQYNHKCPFEDPNAEDQTNGCFYRCRFFQYNIRPSINEWTIWLEETLKRYYKDK